jgi:hypothetical protein
MIAYLKQKHCRIATLTNTVQKHCKIFLLTNTVPILKLSMYSSRKKSLHKVVPVFPDSVMAVDKTRKQGSQLLTLFKTICRSQGYPELERACFLHSHAEIRVGCRQSSLTPTSAYRPCVCVCERVCVCVCVSSFLFFLLSSLSLFFLSAASVLL